MPCHAMRNDYSFVPSFIHPLVNHFLSPFLHNLSKGLQFSLLLSFPFPSSVNFCFGIRPALSLLLHPDDFTANHIVIVGDLNPNRFSFAFQAGG